VGCPAMSPINVDTCKLERVEGKPILVVARQITVFMLVTNFAYSCKSSCSRGVNCGGGEFGCEVDRDSVEVMAWIVFLRKQTRRG
jgi:hypothetical protein